MTAPWDDYEKLLFELAIRSGDAQQTALIAANKMDEDAAGPNLKEFRKRFPKVEIPEIMAAIDEGVPELKERFRQAARG